ncbi:hypothetical protein FPSE_04207 [Fusarium pseudograminearum CS3096]|uniref:Uncharacterized protein n=1 Tax=Fusarium pseudograminearum (strain CS3096) TaxID=1028729 RepID=K3VLQ7_FUSPC|nr:hypothetical protein FPSE_04207 [Fusarium pseudograminearum CS3096]EKJ75564.1 hypothetical protein FPSE_04207 [Fusarium pseudograminearum CS3096]
MRARSDLLALASSSQPGKSSLNQPFFSPPCDAATHRDSGALVVAVALAGPGGHASSCTLAVAGGGPECLLLPPFTTTATATATVEICLPYFQP